MSDWQENARLILFDPSELCVIVFVLLTSVTVEEPLYVGHAHEYSVPATVTVPLTEEWSSQSHPVLTGDSLKMIEIVEVLFSVLVAVSFTVKVNLWCPFEPFAVSVFVLAILVLRYL